MSHFFLSNTADSDELEGEGRGAKGSARKQPGKGAAALKSATTVRVIGAAPLSAKKASTARLPPAHAAPPAAQAGSNLGLAAAAAAAAAAAKLDKTSQQQQEEEEEAAVNPPDVDMADVAEPSAAAAASGGGSTAAAAAADAEETSAGPASAAAGSKLKSAKKALGNKGSKAAAAAADADDGVESDGWQTEDEEGDPEAEYKVTHMKHKNWISAVCVLTSIALSTHLCVVVITLGLSQMYPA